MRRMVKKGSSSQSCSSPRLLIAGLSGSKWRWGLELITEESLESDLDHQHTLDLPKIIEFVCFSVDVETGRQWKFKTRSFFKVPVITAAPFWPLLKQHPTAVCGKGPGSCFETCEINKHDAFLYFQLLSVHWKICGLHFIRTAELTGLVDDLVHGCRELEASHFFMH